MFKFSTNTCPYHMNKIILIHPKNAKSTIAIFQGLNIFARQMWSTKPYSKQYHTLPENTEGMPKNFLCLIILFLYLKMLLPSFIYLFCNCSFTFHLLLYLKDCNENISIIFLTHFSPVSHFYTPWNVYRGYRNVTLG